MRVVREPDDGRGPTLRPDPVVTLSTYYWMSDVIWKIGR